MPALNSYDYAIVRVVPCVERGEYINAGVILFCRTRRFLDALVYLDIPRLTTLYPAVDLDMVQRHLDIIPLVCAGSADAGAIGQLSQSERFHWLVSPRSTIIQTSPAHSGLSTDPAATLEHLLKTMVLLP
ncbi:MAG: DUF3037 domain-containing protein [Chloroflexi bacterium]|nr:MAG: DUF3037 domain-containing protein [Chloroflexota bacterium]TMD72403.1 MAG: DUF3037 domain-containing protein [Chloroflexota bacterium]